MKYSLKGSKPCLIKCRTTIVIAFDVALVVTFTRL